MRCTMTETKQILDSRFLREICDLFIFSDFKSGHEPSGIVSGVPSCVHRFEYQPDWSHMEPFRDHFMVRILDSRFDPANVPV